MTKYLPSIAFLIAAITILGCAQPTPTEKITVDSPTTTPVSTQHTPKQTNQIAGKYEFGTDIEKGPVGLITIHPLSDTVALFWLDVNRGAPSYNMGLLAGQMTIKNHVGTFTAKNEETNTGCVLKFEFSKEKITVVTDPKKDDCGFGGSVYADNTYTQTDRSMPTYFINGEGDTVLFKDLKLNQ